MTDSNNIQQHRQYKILLVGDSCIDAYRYGTVDRISPEAPVPVFKFAYEESVPGMAGNVKRNLESFGCHVDFYTSNEINIKTRLIDLRSKQHLIRIDIDTLANPVLPSAISDLYLYDAVIISDYNKGAVSYDIIKWLRRNLDCPIFMDTKKTDLACFDGIYVKINELEYKNRTSINDTLVVTLGDRGAMYQTTRDSGFKNVCPCAKVEVVDVTGAGDTFLAAFAFEFLNTNDHTAAINFANRAAGVTVQHFGVYAPSLEEIQ